MIGESVAVNGACLTVVARDDDAFDFEVGPETLAKTTLGKLAVGDRVNLERALRVGDPLGGHFVTGHVDGVGAGSRRGRDGRVADGLVRLPAGALKTCSSRRDRSPWTG